MFVFEGRVARNCHHIDTCDQAQKQTENREVDNSNIHVRLITQIDEKLPMFSQITV